jgi:hypothetical protein
MVSSDLTGTRRPGRISGDSGNVRRG